MPVKGQIPVVEEDFDLSRPGYTARNAINAVVGVGLLLGVIAVAQSAYNRVSEQTNAVSQMEAF